MVILALVVGSLLLMKRKGYAWPRRRGWQRPEGPDRSGFTLVELLVVIAIIAILASIAIPAVVGAKQYGYGIACMSNQKQLALAWQLYIDEHEDYLPYNYGPRDTRKTVADGKFKNWVNNVMTWELDAENIDTVLAVKGGIGPYLSGNATPYRCPSDYVVSDLQRAAGWTARVRSHSMNAMLGYAGPEFTTNGINVNNPDFKQFFKSAEIPTPSDIFVFIEEHPDSINDGYFLNRPNVPEWVELPASYHRGGANLSFADGHMEFRRWRCSTTRVPALADVADLPIALPEDEREDFDWLMQRMSVSRYYRSNK